MMLSKDHAASKDDRSFILLTSSSAATLGVAGNSLETSGMPDHSLSQKWTEPYECMVHSGSINVHFETSKNEITRVQFCSVFH